MMAGGARPEPKEPFRPSARQVIGGLIALVLVIFIATNFNTAEVTLLFWSFELPLWIVLAVTAVLSVLVGMALGARRTKRKYMEV